MTATPQALLRRGSQSGRTQAPSSLWVHGCAHTYVPNHAPMNSCMQQPDTHLALPHRQSTTDALHAYRVMLSQHAWGIRAVVEHSTGCICCVGIMYGIMYGIMAISWQACADRRIPYMCRQVNKGIAVSSWALHEASTRPNPMMGHHVTAMLHDACS